MKGTNTDLIYLGAGPLAAIVLGVALVPLRGVTVASNFTFAFLALTIAIAEFGGRLAAVTTALASALSLDFFLTEPYQRLAIAEKHDVIAFVGLAGCSLLAAALGSRRRERVADLRAARAHAEVVRSAVGELARSGSLGARLSTIVDAARATFPLAAVAVRDMTGERLIASPREHGVTPAPDAVLASDTLLMREHHARSRLDAPLPAEGATLALQFENRPVGWLDVWGNGVPISAGSRRELLSLAGIVAALIARTQREESRLSQEQPR